jgi:hypothetical protein
MRRFPGGEWCCHAGCIRLEKGKAADLYPEGITDISRGSRSDSDDHPRLEFKKTGTPEGVQDVSVSSWTIAPSATPAGVEFIWDVKPGVFVAIATRPRANFSDPCRDQETSRHVRIL